MARIIEFTIISVLAFSCSAYANSTQVKVDNAHFVKCGKGLDCSYKIKVREETYKIVSSPDTNVNMEVQNIFNELEKENAKESKPFCVTGKIISISSKKIKDSSFFKISSIGKVDTKEKSSTPQRSREAMGETCAY